MFSVDHIRFNARQCRELADDAITAEARKVLSDMAAEYEQEAVALESASVPRTLRPEFSWPLS